MGPDTEAAPSEASMVAAVSDGRIRTYKMFEDTAALAVAFG
jgi:hypothetical protein